MIIYNTTFNIDLSIEKEWIEMLKNETLPRVYETGLFEKHIFSQVLVEEEMGGKTFSLQLFAPSLQTLEAYESTHKATIEENMFRKFNGRFVMFNTLLEIQDD